MARQTLSLPFNGDKLRVLREKAGLSVQALALAVTESGYRVHRANMGKIERGIYKPPAPLLKAIVAALDKLLVDAVTVDDLLDEEAA